MPERQYTYRVEIDAGSAQDAARQARAIFEKELGEIVAKAGTPAGTQSQAGQMQQALQQQAQAAEAARQAAQAMTRIDLAAPVEGMTDRLQEAKRLYQQALADYERVTTKANDSRPDARARALREDSYRAIGTAAGPEAEAAARRMGNVGRIGNYGAEFKDDETGHYTERESDHFAIGGAGQDLNAEKKRFTIAEMQELMRVEGELYSSQLEMIRAQKEADEALLRSKEQEIEGFLRLASDNANDDQVNQAIAQISDEIGRVDRSIADLAEQEIDLLQTIERANKRAADYAAEKAAEAARHADIDAGRLHIKAPPGAAPGPTSAGAEAGTFYTQQAAITVSAKSVENARELLDAMEQIAGATERYNAALRNASARDFELENIRARAQAEQKAREDAEGRIEDKRTTEAGNRAAIAANLNAAKQAQAQQTAAVNAQGRARVELAKGEARIMAEVAKGNTVARAEQEKRLTEITKQEMRERERAAKASAKAQQAAATSAGPGAGAGNAGLGKLPFGMTMSGLAYGAAGALGIYGADQIARGTYDAGYEGAQQLRTIDAFEATAERAGVSSAAVIKAIRSASKETITNTDAMGLANQLLARKWAASSGDMIGTIETLVKASRKFSQTYLNPETGAAYSVGEVFGRLVKYISEGNKELVDQFGISTQLIAEALGTSKDGLAGAGREGERAAGLVALLNDELARTGEAGLSIADKFEADTARIEESWNRIKRNLAEPVSVVVTAAADVTDQIMVGAGAADADTVKREAERLSTLETMTAEKDNLRDLISTFDQLDAVAAKNAKTAAFYREELTALGQAIINNGSATDAQVAQLDRLQRTLGLITAGQDSYTIAMSATTDEAISQNAELTQLAIALGTYQNLYADGTITLEQYTAVTDMLAGAMRNVAEAAGLAAGAIGAVNSAAMENGRGGTFYNAAIAGPGAAAGPAAFQARQDQYSFTKDRIDAQTKRDAEARDARQKADEAAAKKAASEWESAAKKAQSAFEAAAEKTASEFKATLEKVPGLFGTSEVTAEDMEAAKLGNYKPKADERLRVLADEVLNKKDTAEDPAEWARRMGLDPGTDPRIVLQEARARWADSSLFQGGNNLDLINAAAVEDQKFRDQESESGRQALLKYFGLDSGTGLEDPAARGAFSEMIGLTPDEATAAGTEARAAFDAGFYAPTTGATAAGADGEAGAGMASTLAKELETDVTAGEVADTLYSIGGSILGRIHAGYEAAAAKADWSDALIASLAADVTPIVLESIADQFPPK